MLKTSIANLALRGLTLVSKFVLLLFIARFLSPEELGVWGLVNVTIGISLYFLGLDFYVYNTREILAVSEAERTPLIRDQLVFHALIYVVVLPLLLSVFLAGLIAWEYLPWFYGLLVLEHISQESMRLLITLSRPTMANLVLFFRSGAWVYAVVAAGLYRKGVLDLSFIWSGWIVGVLVSIGVAAFALRHMGWGRTAGISVDLSWMRKGVRVVSNGRALRISCISFLCHFSVPPCHSLGFSLSIGISCSISGERQWWESIHSMPTSRMSSMSLSLPVLLSSFIREWYRRTSRGI